MFRSSFVCFRQMVKYIQYVTRWEIQILKTQCFFQYSSLASTAESRGMLKDCAYVSPESDKCKKKIGKEYNYTYTYLEKRLRGLMK